MIDDTEVNLSSQAVTREGALLKKPLTFLRIFVLLLVILISVLIFIFRDQVENLSRYGYPGIFLVTVLTNATVLLPVPGSIMVFAMGAVFNPIGVAIAAATGAALGELSGYLAGYSGRAIIEDSQRYKRLVDWLKANRKWSSLAIFVLAAIPNPLFDMAGIAAGALRIPAWYFLLFCVCGKFLNMLLFAFLGDLSLNQIFSP